MPKPTEERLAHLKQLRNAAPTDAEPALRKALTDRSNLVVAEAAKIAAELRCMKLIPDLLATFSRLFEDPVKADPKCWGKTAIVRALTLLDYDQSSTFLRGATHIQMEPVYGGQEDSALHLRANSVLALVQCTDISRPLIFRHLVNALADTSETVRIEAVRAVEQMNGEEAALVLRLKAHAGDSRPAVIGQVFDSLLGLEGENAVGFIAVFLDPARSEICDEAALSLGASRLPVAVEVLIQAWGGARNRDWGAVLLRAMSSSRDESALAFLFDLVRDGLTWEAEAALEALELHRDSTEIQSRIQQAKHERSNSR